MMPVFFITHGLYRTPFFFISAITLHRTSPLPPSVFRPGKGLTSRASAMHSYVLLLRGLWIHTAELLVPHYLSSAPPDSWPVVNYIGRRRFALSWNDDMRQQDDYSQLVR